MDKKKKGIILTVLAIISLIAITVGVTYAFFNYAKEGSTENTISSGTITFLYTETSKVGRGIMLENAYPISDSQGKNLTGEGNVFDFKITSSNDMNATIPYEITARKKSDSTLPEEAVRIYLTKVNGTEEEVLLDNYNNLPQTDKVQQETHIEKTLYTSKVPANEDNYNQEYRLRMWIDEDTDFSPDENNNYPYNNKTFTVTVNVYANAKVVTEEEIENASKAEISSLSVEGTELTKVENEEYDYETTLPEGTTSTTLDIKTISEYATVEIERLDSLAYSSNIKRLSTKKTLELLPGDNYFKITVTSENREVENQYTLKISVKYIEMVTIFNKTFEVIDAEPTLTTSSNNTNDASGLYKSIDTNDGSPTYYFRGNVENNYIDFAGFTWRIVRINEDGTIRIVMQDGINNNTTYKFNSVATSKDNMYYSNSDTAKPTLETWYNDKIASNTNYSNRVASGNYFCEEAKVTYNSNATNSGASMTVYSSYTPNFTCEKNGKDGNGKGYVSGSVGLISYDEVLHAGGYPYVNNDSYYLYNNTSFWTMSPAGVSGSNALAWYVSNAGYINGNRVNDPTLRLRPVLNLKADTTVTGLGTSDSHWVVTN